MIIWKFGRGWREANFWQTYMIRGTNYWLQSPLRGSDNPLPNNLEWDPEEAKDEDEPEKIKAL